MHNSIWKLTALAGVVGIGFLVVLQAQRELTRRNGPAATGQVADAPQEQSPENGSEPVSAAEAPPGDQPEPQEWELAGANAGQGLDFREVAVRGSGRPDATDDSDSQPFGNGPEPAGDAPPRQPEPAADIEPPAVVQAMIPDADVPPASVPHTADGGGPAPRLMAVEPRVRPASHETAADPPLFGQEDDKEEDPFGQPAAQPTAPRMTFPTPSAAAEPEPAEPLDDFDVPSRPAPQDRPEPLFTPEAEPETDDDPFGPEPAGEKPGAAGPPRPALNAPFDAPPFSAEDDQPGDLQGAPTFPGVSMPEFADPDTAREPAVPAEPELGEPEPAFSEPTEIAPPTLPTPAADDDAPDAPRRLEPADAAPLDTVPADGAADDLSGDGTVDTDAPRGPQRPQLNIEKVAPPNAILGQPLVYSILVKNVGDSPAHEVAVEDRIPRGTQLSGTIPQAEMVGKTLTWKLGTMRPGEERKIAVRVVPVEEGQVGSVATVNFVAEVASRTTITAPRLQIDLNAPRQAALGEPVAFAFKLTNSGTGDATGVVIRDLIPDELHHPEGNDLQYELGTLPAGQSREIKLTLAAARVGEAVNRIEVTADGNVSTDAEATVEIISSRLSLTRSGPKHRYLGRPAVYENVVANESDRPIGGVTVVEVLPAGMELAEASANGQYDPVKRAVGWRIERLEPNERKVLHLKLVPKSPGTKTSVVQAFEATGTREEVRSQTEVEGFPTLAADVSGLNGPVAVGERVTLRIQVGNRGTDAATNVRVQLAVPAEMQVVSAEGIGETAPDTRELTFGPVQKIDVGGKAQFEVVLQAVKPGDVRLGVQIDADHMRRPMVQEQGLILFEER